MVFEVLMNYWHMKTQPSVAYCCGPECVRSNDVHRLIHRADAYVITLLSDSSGSSIPESACAQCSSAQ